MPLLHDNVNHASDAYILPGSQDVNTIFFLSEIWSRWFDYANFSCINAWSSVNIQCCELKKDDSLFKI